MQAIHPKVLILDDDPMHLEIYGLLMKQAGYEALPTLVRFTGTEIPCEQCLGLVLLDYRLNSVKTSPDFARRSGQGLCGRSQSRGDGDLGLGDEQPGTLCRDFSTGRQRLGFSRGQAEKCSRLGGSWRRG